MFDSMLHDRRRFIRIAMGFSTGALLAGCGGGGGADATGAGVTVVTAPAAAATPAAPSAAESAHPLGLALNLAYLGGQYYGMAAHGAGLDPALVAGAGPSGPATGARRAEFVDPVVAGAAAELADDKALHVAVLRAAIGPQVAAQPKLDLSTGASGAFAIAAQRAGIVASGAAFDPYASDENFLLGAFLIENAVAAAYRTLLAQNADATTTALVGAQLGDAIYHGGLIRTLLDARAASNQTIATALTNTGAMLAALDGSDVGDQTLAGASGASSNLLDADRRPIPFTRANAQILKALYLSSDGVGGFLPAGANDVAA